MSITIMLSCGRLNGAIIPHFYGDVNKKHSALLKKGKDNSYIMDFLNDIDVLVDGRFVLKLKSYDAKFRG